MAERRVEDRLREEYSDLLPDIGRVVQQLEAQISYHVLPVRLGLKRYERVVVKSRVKDCESAIRSLLTRLRAEGRGFDSARMEEYTLARLRDLAGVRVLAFPRGLVSEIDKALRPEFQNWTPDPVPGYADVFKYWGRCTASSEVCGEYQIVPMSIGLFWEIEHSTVYKPTLELKDVDWKTHLKKHTEKVLAALQGFEQAIESLAKKDDSRSRR